MGKERGGFSLVGWQNKKEQRLIGAICPLCQTRFFPAMARKVCPKCRTPLISKPEPVKAES